VRIEVRFGDDLTSYGARHLDVLTTATWHPSPSISITRHSELRRGSTAFVSCTHRVECNQHVDPVDRSGFHLVMHLVPAGEHMEHPHV
jgi:hypothetical protein